MERQYIIQRNSEIKQRTFRFAMQVKSIIGTMKYENNTEVLLQQSWISKKGENDIFEISLLEHKQTNERGVHQWDKELNKIKNKLDFEANAANCSTVRVTNIVEIAEKWQKIRPVMLKNYEHTDYLKYIIKGTDGLLQDENRLTKATAAANEHVMLMPGIYGSYGAEKVKSIQARSIRGVLPGIHLPVKALCHLKEYNEITGACSFLIEGTPDYENFEEAKFRQAVKEMTKTFNARTTMEVGYLEKYDLDQYHWINSAGRMYNYYLPGFISNETICTLSREN